jgi:hypothetical protein
MSNTATAFLAGYDHRPEVNGGIVLGFQVGLRLAMTRPEFCFEHSQHLVTPQLADSTDAMVDRLVTYVQRSAAPVAVQG